MKFVWCDRKSCLLTVEACVARRRAGLRDQARMRRSRATPYSHGVWVPGDDRFQCADCAIGAQREKELGSDAELYRRESSMPGELRRCFGNLRFGGEA